MILNPFNYTVMSASERCSRQDVLTKAPPMR